MIHFLQNIIRHDTDYGNEVKLKLKLNDHNQDDKKGTFNTIK